MDSAQALAKLQEKCRDLGIGYAGYPATDAQIEWLDSEVKELRELLDNVTGLRAIERSQS